MLQRSRLYNQFVTGMVPSATHDSAITIDATRPALSPRRTSKLHEGARGASPLSPAAADAGVWCATRFWLLQRNRELEESDRTAWRFAAYLSQSLIASIQTTIDEIGDLPPKKLSCFAELDLTEYPAGWLGAALVEQARRYSCHPVPLNRWTETIHALAPPYDLATETDLDELVGDPWPDAIQEVRSTLEDELPSSIV